MTYLSRTLYIFCCSLLVCTTVAQTQAFDGATAEITFNSDFSFTIDIPPGSTSYTFVDFYRDERVREGRLVQDGIREATIQSDKNVSCFLSQFNEFFWDVLETEHWLRLHRFSTSAPLWNVVKSPTQMYCFETSASQPGRDSYTLFLENRSGEKKIMRMSKPYLDAHVTMDLDSTYPGLGTDVKRTILFELEQKGLVNVVYAKAFESHCVGFFRLFKSFPSYYMQFPFSLSLINEAGNGIKKVNFEEIFCCAIDRSDERCTRDRDAYRYRLKEIAEQNQ